MSNDLQALRVRAMGFLARREHSRQELKRKLAGPSVDAQLIETVIDELAEQNLQSDERFTEAYIQKRMAAGFGPRMISSELSARGISELPDVLQNDEDEIWQQQLERVWAKKYKGNTAADAREKAKQQRFLLGRGFSHRQVSQLLN